MAEASESRENFTKWLSCRITHRDVCALRNGLTDRQTSLSSFCDSRRNAVCKIRELSGACSLASARYSVGCVIACTSTWRCFRRRRQWWASRQATTFRKRRTPPSGRECLSTPYARYSLRISYHRLYKILTLFYLDALDQLSSIRSIVIVTQYAC